MTVDYIRNDTGVTALPDEQVESSRGRTSSPRRAVSGVTATEAVAEAGEREAAKASWASRESDSESESQSESESDSERRRKLSAELENLRRSCIEMALNRIDGKEDLYVGGIFALRRPKALAERRITHVLSVVRFDPAGIKGEVIGSTWQDYGKNYKHMMIDIDDVDDSDLLIHLPQAVRFIEEGLYPPKESGSNAADGEKNTEDEKEESDEEVSPTGKGAEQASTTSSNPVPTFDKLKLKPVSERIDPTDPTGAVYVHCAMGKSRSVSVVIAYLLWKYPSRFGRSAHSAKDPSSKNGGAKAAVDAALKWVKNSREIAEPNSGFMDQLRMWWDMGCPADVEGHPIYQRWEYAREIDLSVAVGMAPARLRFEDEVSSRHTGNTPVSAPGPELRCKKCRRVLATGPFILDHQPPDRGDERQRSVCQHFFIEPLSWMRGVLEEGVLEGRLACPSEKCGATIGRYSWKGFKCSCSGWVTPAFSLQKSRVDEVATRTAAGNAPTALGIRMPPGANRL